MLCFKSQSRRVSTRCSFGDRLFTECSTLATREARSYIAAMKVKDADILFIPGTAGADEGHWLSRWQGRLSTGRNLPSRDGDADNPAALATRIADAVNDEPKPSVLVAHGIGVAAAIHAIAKITTPIAGAFLVSPWQPAETLPSGPLPFPSILVASRNDPKYAFEDAEQLAGDWGSLFIDAGEIGGIDAASGHGPWPEGSMTFARFVSRLKPN